MKKFVMIFSAIILPLFMHGFPFKIELNLLLQRYLRSHKQKTETKDTQTYINEHNKELFAYFASVFNPNEPLPFVGCTEPAFFDLLKSHANKSLFEQALANLYFNPCMIVDPKTNSNIFHICAKAGTSKFLKQLFNYCKERNIEYRHILDRKNSHGMTPLGLATYYARTRCCQVLLSHGARPRVQPGSIAHLAAISNLRGESKRNKIIELLHDYDETLLTEVNRSKRGAEETAKLFSFTSTAHLIKKYKMSMLQQLHEEKSLYFHLLHPEIFEATLSYVYSPLLSTPASEQSLSVVLP